MYLYSRGFGGSVYSLSMRSQVYSPRSLWVFKFTYPVVGVALWILEVKIVLSLFTEFGRCDIHSYLNPPCVSGLLYGNANQLQTCSVSTEDIKLSNFH